MHPLHGLDDLDPHQVRQEFRRLRRDETVLRLQFDPDDALLLQALLEKLAVASPLPQDTPDAWNQVSVIRQQMAALLPAEDDIQLRVRLETAWALVCVLQFASRHPELPDLFQVLIRAVGNAVAHALEQDDYPMLLTMLRLGWDERYDVPLRRGWN
jgi:hypothetical protein